MPQPTRCCECNRIRGREDGRHCPLCAHWECIQELEEELRRAQARAEAADAELEAQEQRIQQVEARLEQAELEARRLQASLGDEAERVPAEQERAEMLQECWDEGYGAEGEDEVCDWDTDEWQIWDQEAATARFHAGANVGHRP